MTPVTILRGARVIDPVQQRDSVSDLVIIDGRIATPAEAAAVCERPDIPVIDLSGMVVAPGFIDLHVHLREPGQTHKETIASATRAAAAGGFSTVVAMPNTTPPIDSPERLQDVQEKIRETAQVRVLQTAALSVGREGQALTDAAALRHQGAVALTDDGSCLQDAGLMLAALKAAAAAGIPVIEHCEDAGLAAGGLLHRGTAAAILGLPGQPAAAESLIAARDLLLSAEAGWPVHLQHISSAQTVHILRQARKHGIPLTAEVTPHHLLLTDQACLEHGTQAKMNPPLRDESDRQALIQALCDGSIAAIATDHAPHTAAEKAAGWQQAPFGIVGLETAVGICLRLLYHSGLMPLSRIIAAFTQGPRDILGLSQGTLAPGSDADIVVLDLDAEYEIQVNNFLSKGRNCPYEGLRCKGRPAALMVGGRWVHSTLPCCPVTR